MDVIVSVRRERGHFRLALASGEVVVVGAELFRERPFDEGDMIDLEEYDQWLLPRQYRAALDRAVGLLALRAHARGEIEAKLRQAHFRPAVIEMVLYKLEREGLLDDADFSREWAEARARRRLGPRRIAQELRMKGVAQEEIDAALQGFDEEEQLEAAVALARKGFARGKAGEDPRKAQQRVAAMLARKGYDWEVVRRAVEAARDEG